MHMQWGSNEVGGGHQSSTPQWGLPCSAERGGEVLFGGSVANPIAWPRLSPLTAPARIYIPLQVEAKSQGAAVNAMNRS